MKILILGSGGRAHAFCWKISQSELCSQLFIAPGNAGTSQYGKNINIDISDFKIIKNICISNKIDLVLVGPEEPLVKGVYDFFKKDRELQDIIITGPSAEGAKLEGSKAFAKAFMERHNIPTAAYKEFSDETFEEGLNYIKSHELPVVLKADGLAGGKGVIICNNYVEAMGEYELIIQKSKFGDAGKIMVVEKFLDGIEMSVFILTDGKGYVLFPEAKDYKKIMEGDTGLNTGGMGAVSPVPFATDIFMEKVKEKIIEPTIKGLQQENIDYKGFVFFGLIKVNDEPMVIEYNCRMGDPETEVVLLRLKNDLLKLLIAADTQQLHLEKIEIDKRSAATIVAVSEGYPLEYKTGFRIDFGYLENPHLKKHIQADGGVMVFHAGTKEENGEVITNGGRVLAVSSLAETLSDAIDRSKEILEQIHFEGMYYRSDIGYEFIQ
ncbi:MAG TPA: phosphoribosylamine--glycine ligase [Chitinophagaceae bacterium]|nr:phosphoribosylamine--glycine ligase [Chitinophagaceae bacterium]